MAKRKPTLEVYEDIAGEWRWRLISSNKQIVCTSHEPFDTKSNAKRAAKRAIESIDLLISRGATGQLVFEVCEVPFPDRKQR